MSEAGTISLLSQSSSEYHVNQGGLVKVISPSVAPSPAGPMDGGRPSSAASSQARRPIHPETRNAQLYI